MPPEAADSATPQSGSTDKLNQAPIPNGHQTAHVLFLDIVGFTKLRSLKQKFVLGKLQEIVRATRDFREARKAEKLLALPTGDGMALVFLTSVDSSGKAVSCAEEITRAILAHNKTTSEDNGKIQVRMGIHSGNVVQVRDVNDRMNVAGEGINTAQRVMDCGDIGHILLSNVAFRLLPDEPDRTGQFKPLGIVRVKHDQEINLFSWWHNEIGNKETPSKIDSEKKQEELRFGKIKAKIAADEAIKTEKIKADLEAAAKRQRISWLLALLAVVVLVGATYWISQRAQSSGPPVSLYVYVFKPQTPQRYSSRAISKGLTQDFKRSFRFLQPKQIVNSPVETVTASPSTSVPADRAAVAIAVGRQNGARYVLTGTVESDIDDGDRTKLSAENPIFNVKINVELYDTESGKRLWNQPYSATSFKELIAREDSILRDVCHELHVTRNTSSDEPREAQAHWDYLVGRFWAFQRANAKAEEKQEFTRRANKSYQLAIDSRLNPYYALALAGLADIKLSEAGLVRNPKSAAKEALALLLKAIGAAQIVGNEVAEPYAAIGTENWWLERDYLNATIAFQTALKLDPDLADVHKRYSNCLALMGDAHAREAQHQMDIALRMEPESPVFQLASAQNCFFAGEYGNAIEQLRQLIENQTKNNELADPAAYRFLAMALEGNNQHDEALKELKVAEKQHEATKNDPDFLSVKAHIQVRLGEKNEAIKIAGDLERRYEEGIKDDKEYVSPYVIAVIYAPMPNQEQNTLKWLRRAKDEFDPRLNWINFDARFKEWRKDDRFMALVQEAGLPPSKDGSTAVITARP